ncbi:MAG: peptidoglycan-associated lipoprotein [Saprospiraceae bacterium]|jgi:peptidoglycan-associated lipoprotein
MRQITTLILFILSIGTLFAQPLNRSTAEKMLALADETYANRDYYNALEWYEKVYEETSDLGVAYKIAMVNEALRDYRKAERSWKRIVNKRTRRTVNPYMPDARFHYAHMLKMNGDYGEAKSEFQLYISEAEDPALIARAKVELIGCEMGREMDEVAGLKIDNGGKNLNTKYSEYSPQLVSNSEMYFTAIQAKDVIVIEDAKDDFHSRAFVATKEGDKWGKPTPLGTNINREGYHVGNLSITPDGSRMYFTRALLEESDLGESKIYYSDKSGNSWGAANEVQGVNGDYLAKQPVVGELFGDEVLFFVSDMAGGYGGFDIYYSTRRGDTYTPPVNLGNVINTTQDEETPYYQEGFMYFSSDGHAGLGGFDIFSAEWDGANWSTPQNLGKGYNSPQDDLYFSVDADGYNGLLVSNREGTKSAHGRTCCNDIWTVEKQKVILDLATTVFDDKKVALNGATIQLVQMISNTPGETKENTKEKVNLFTFPLDREMAYMLIATKEGYYPDSLQFNTAGTIESKTFEEQFYLKPLPVEEEYVTIITNQPIELENIFYDLDDDKILPDAEKDLTFIMNLMDKYPDMIIELSSHTDAQGTAGYNRKLSQRRAESAKTWLTGRSISSDRIVALGYGESQIRNQCVNGVKCTDEEHRYNRRTEFKITAGPTSIEIKKTELKKKDK